MVVHETAIYLYRSHIIRFHRCYGIHGTQLQGRRSDDHDFYRKRFASAIKEEL
jgi:hypothetical protein